jgi:hypothetical protein
MNRLCILFMFSMLGIAPLVTAASLTAMDNLQISPKNEELACYPVNKRVSVCGDTDFKNKFSAGFKISFKTIDPNGRLTSVGPVREIKGSSKSCDALMTEEAVPVQTRREAVNVCRQMFKEHQALFRVAP